MSDTEGNTDGIRVLLEKRETVPSGLIFCNLIDFDMLYGHRRDVPGFGGRARGVRSRRS